MTSHPESKRNSRYGVTLIEVVVSMILISSVLLVTITASANLFKDQSSQRQNVRVHELLGIFLDEVATQGFRDLGDNPTFGLESDEVASDRSTFDDIDDYANYAVSPPTYHDGTVIDGFDGWSIQVAVSTVAAGASTRSISETLDDPLRMVTVTAFLPTGEAVSESIMRSEVSSNLASTASHDRLRRLNLSFSNDRELRVVAPMMNQPTGGN